MTEQQCNDFILEKTMIFETLGNRDLFYLSDDSIGNASPNYKNGLIMTFYQSLDKSEIEERSQNYLDFLEFLDRPIFKWNPVNSFISMFYHFTVHFKDTEISDKIVKKVGSIPDIELINGKDKTYYDSIVHGRCIEEDDEDGDDEYADGEYGEDDEEEDEYEYEQDEQDEEDEKDEEDSWD